MANRKPRTVLYRRKRESRTNYGKRLKLLLSHQPRLVVRFTNQRVIGQIITFTPQGDKVHVATDSSALKKLGWNFSLKNMSAAYLTGMLLAKMALKKGQKNAILDTGFKTPLKKGKVTAFIKGVVDGGLDLPHGDDEMFPDEARISGKHVQDYATHLKSKKEVYSHRFGEYLKRKAEPEQMSAQFKAVKQKIV